MPHTTSSARIFPGDTDPRDRIESETRQSLHVLDPFFNLVAAQTPSGAIPSIVVDPDVVSLDGRREAIEMESEDKEDDTLHATVRRANASHSDIFSLQSSCNPTRTIFGACQLGCTPGVRGIVTACRHLLQYLYWLRAAESYVTRSRSTPTMATT